MPIDPNDLFIVAATCLLRYLPVIIRLLLEQFRKHGWWVRATIIGGCLIFAVGLEYSVSNFDEAKMNDDGHFVKVDDA